MEELGLPDICIAGIAKGPDRNAGREPVFSCPGAEAVQSAAGGPRSFIICSGCATRRTVLPSARTAARRKKDIREAGLQEIPGIGPTRKRALLRHFGTLKAIERASLPDLALVPGINAETARKIYEFFHERAVQ